MKFLMIIFLSLFVTACDNGKVLDNLAIEDIPEIEYNRELEGRIRKLGYQIKRINEDETKDRMSMMRRKGFDRKMSEIKKNYENLVDFIGANESKKYENRVRLEYQKIFMNLKAIKMNYPIDRSYNSVGVNL